MKRHRDAVGALLGALETFGGFELSRIEGDCLREAKVRVGVGPWVDPEAEVRPVERALSSMLRYLRFGV